MNSPNAVVLVVEDSEPDVLLLRRAFTETRVNAEVVAALTGDESLALVDGRFAPEESEALDLIILDISMPGLSGLDTLKQLRERSHLRDVPIIIFTESRLTDDVQTALDLGATSFANKVATIAELNALVRNIAYHWLPDHKTNLNTEPVAV